MGDRREELVRALGRVLEGAIARERQLAGEDHPNELAAAALGRSIARALRCLSNPPTADEQGLEEALEAVDNARLGPWLEMWAALSALRDATSTYRKRTLPKPTHSD